MHTHMYSHTYNVKKANTLNTYTHAYADTHMLDVRVSVGQKLFQLLLHFLCSVEKRGYTTAPLPSPSRTQSLRSTPHLAHTIRTDAVHRITCTDKG
mmetsp:Transcript_42393/g.109079  ORF Transcript_42393/g.109079 Transcript_42393/m.109079 type:complete len:96 (-) Transcript_42393:312-599(-)